MRGRTRVRMRERRREKYVEQDASSPRIVHATRHTNTRHEIHQQDSIHTPHGVRISLPFSSTYVLMHSK